MARSGYINGSDMLLYIGSGSSAKAIGHCTSHSCTFSSETKDRAVKPTAATAGTGAGLWKQKSVTGLSISISADGLCFYSEGEAGFKECLTSWKTGQVVNAKCMARAESGSGGSTPTAYLEGSFIITSIQRTDPAGDDATYSIQLENSGEPTTFAPAQAEV